MPKPLTTHEHQAFEFYRADGFTIARALQEIGREDYLPWLMLGEAMQDFGKGLDRAFKEFCARLAKSTNTLPDSYRSKEVQNG